jgi:hypothetical protein
MTPDALPSPPRKVSWKRWTLAAACVVAVIIFAMQETTPKKEPVAVWFVRATNYFGYTKLAFRGTNGLAGEVEFVACVVIGNVPHGKASARSGSPFDQIMLGADAGTNFDFILKVPPKDVPYYVEWAVDDFLTPTTRWERFRWGCCNFFSAHGMPRLAHRFLPRAKLHYIPSTEIKE